MSSWCHDVRRETAAAHLDKGARWAAQPPRRAGTDELILTSLPGPAEVGRVATGGDGVIHGAARGANYTDLSTGSPTVMRKLHGVFKERGVHVLDAPVSGGVPGAVHGTLQVMVGGDEAVYQRAKPALEAIGKVGYMGSIGAGTIAKLVHNAISLSTRAIVAEAFTLGVKAGVPARGAARGGAGRLVRPGRISFRACCPTWCSRATSTRSSSPCASPGRTSDSRPSWLGSSTCPWP